MWEPPYIRDSVERLQKRSPQVFGADLHRFSLNAPLSEKDAQAFERRHRVQLPTDYRQFVTEIGNGGAGPYYGIFALGQMDDGSGFQPWRQGDGFVGTLSEPFPLSAPWNDLTGQPADDLADSDEDEYDRQASEFEKVYYDASRLNGAIPICHMGCALRVWLVLSGPQRGNLWYDYRSDYRGITPLLNGDGSAATFSSWYLEWLDGCLEKIK